MADRLISAEALKQHYAWWGSVDEETSDTMTYPEAKKILDTIVDIQPTIEPIKHGRWIPIAEAEPPLGTHVLVTYKHGEDDYEASELDYGMSKAQNTWHWRRVIAWQPMPEPYEEVTL